MQTNKQTPLTTSLDIKIDRIRLDIKTRLRRMALKNGTQIREVER